MSWIEVSNVESAAVDRGHLHLHLHPHTGGAVTRLISIGPAQTKPFCSRRDASR